MSKVHFFTFTDILEYLETPTLDTSRLYKLWQFGCSWYVFPVSRIAVNWTVLLLFCLYMIMMMVQPFPYNYLSLSLYNVLCSIYYLLFIFFISFTFLMQLKKYVEKNVLGFGGIKPLPAPLSARCMWKTVGHICFRLGVGLQGLP